MAILGGPERNPGLPPARTSTGLGGPIRAEGGLSAPHLGDHGDGLFNHPSTNRGATPGTLNGTPAGLGVGLKNKPSPGGRASTGIFSRKTATPGGLKASAGNKTPTQRTRRVDANVPPKINQGPENAPHHRPRRIESASSRAAHEARQDLAEHNRSGS